MTRHRPGLIAILRGLTPGEAPAVGAALVDAGITTLEVPLNSPSPLESIRLLRDELGDAAQVGAGTVLTVDQVERTIAAGAQLVVSPNTDPQVVRATADAGVASYPGVATVSEAFVALDAGADALKLFPAFQVGIEGMLAWRSVLPPDTGLLPVGGVDASNLADWLTAGAAGAGIGSWLYRAGDDPLQVGARAAQLVRLADAHAPN